MFENLSLPHLLMVLAVAILVFGPKRIPEIAGSMGKGIREFKRHITEGAGPDTPGELPSSRPEISERVSTSAEASAARSRDSSDRQTPKRLLE